MIKRLADWLEKASVGSLWIGLFQGHKSALVLSAAAFAGSMIITWASERGKKWHRLTPLRFWWFLEWPPGGST